MLSVDVISEIYGYIQSTEIKVRINWQTTARASCHCDVC